MDDLTALKSQRTVIKGQLTRFSSFIDKIDQENPNLAELESRLDKIHPLFDNFNEIQTKIELLAVDKADEHETERDNFESKYFHLIATAKSLITAHLTDARVGSSPGSLKGSDHSHIDDDGQTQIRLPKLDLPQFNGAYDNWLFFRDTFTSIIHNNNKINQVQKFHYLRLSLKGEAREVISSLEISANNYDIAWKLLLERYENKGLLIGNHVKALFNLNTIQKESHTELRCMLDSVNKHLRALEVLDQPVKHWDTLIVHMVTNKLDHSTRREWETQNAGKDTPSFDDLDNFLKQRCRLLEALQSGTMKSQSQSTSTTKHKIEHKIKAHVSTTFSNCVLCKEKHLIYNCNKFLDFSTKERYSEAKRLRLCINCLRKTHATKDCISGSCRKCSGKHHTLLHFSQESDGENSNKPESAPNNSALKTEMENPPVQVTSNHSAANPFSNSYQTQHTLLSTAVVQVSDNRGNLHDCRVLLDSGSECSFITEQMCNNLQLKREQILFTISGINEKLTSVNQRCYIRIKAKHSRFEIPVTCLVLPKITENLPCFVFNKQSLNIPPNIKPVLADPDFDKSRPIDILLGAEVFWDLIQTGNVRLGTNKPSLQKTHLGWLVSGQVFANHASLRLTSNFVTTNQLSEQIERFWELEQINPSKTLLGEEAECERHFVDHFKRDINGRFIVSIPFKQNPEEHLGSSLELAKKRFYNLERKLQNNSNLKQKYVRFLDEYREMGHMTNISSNNNDDGYYMPHHGVLREDKVTTQLRVVFDASAVTTSGISLNQIQMVGPVIQQDLISLLLRFRKYAYVVSADISKMYRQVLVAPDQRKYQKILWRSEPTQELTTFQLNTVTYGTAAASFLAVRCLQQLAIECKADLPRISEIIEQDFYMDDLLSGADSVQEASQICSQVYAVLKSGCFELRKWCSNEPLVVKEVCDSNCDNQASMNLEFGSINDNKIEAKTLGLMWSPNTDDLKYKIKSNSNSSKITKRLILSEISRIFDPLGLLGPCIISAKILIQRLWQQQLQWDESIPPDLASQWLLFNSDLQFLNQISIPRRVICHNYTKIELHGFSDASELAYGACAYIRSVNESGDINVQLLCSKTRVAPLKTITMPRLELCAALLLAQLVSKVITSMKLQFDSVHLWTDSMIVLSWIKSASSDWKIFISNRISQIQSLTDVKTWDYVNTKHNPADLLSRGLNPKLIVNSSLWWYGPEWLAKPYHEWPQTKLTFNSSHTYPPEVESEIKKIKITTSIAVSNFNIFTKFSSFTKLQRVVAYCLRFKHNSSNKSERKVGPLSRDELNSATTRLVYLAQRETYSKEIAELRKFGSVSVKSKILSLNPFLCSDGIIKVGGRLKYGSFDSQKKHPAILPPKHALSKLIAESEHRRLLHAGSETVLSSLRERFWIVSGRNLIKKITRCCMRCFRHNPKGIKYLMSDLPKERVTPARPFINCGLDFCGPFLIRDRLTRNYKSVKAYVCIFICLVTKAIHLELVGDLTTNAFMAALRRFTARRGKCSNIYSDNGTNFTGANAELQRLFRTQKSEIQGELASEGIVWHFIPPRAPHFGGLWEAGVKSFKSHLKRVVGNSLLSFEEFYTILAQIEACLNSRPLQPLSADPNDPNALTPSHFLIGDRLTSIPDADYMEIPENRLARFQRLQKLLQIFWKRWSREYLAQLQVRNKWKIKHEELLQPGVLVLIKDDNAPPLKWKIGRVLETHKGDDGVTRVVTLKTPHGTYKRPSTKLCILPNSNTE